MLETWRATVPGAIAKAAPIVDACLDNGVAMLVDGPTVIRAVFHLDVTAEATSRAINVVRDTVTAW